MKVDARVEVECRQTIAFLKGYSYLKLYCEKQSNQKPTANIKLILQEEQIYAECAVILKNVYSSNFSCICPSLLKQILTKQNIASTKNCQEFLVSQVPVLKRNNATNSSTSNHPFYSCNENPCIW